VVERTTRTALLATAFVTFPAFRAVPLTLLEIFPLRDCFRRAMRNLHVQLQKKDMSDYLTLFWGEVVN
jgi:hypothetical protein